MIDYRNVKEFINQNDYLVAARKRHAEIVYFDKELFEDAVTFYNVYFHYKDNPISSEQALTYADFGVRLNADLFKSMLPMDEKTLDYFYKITPFYFFHDIRRFMDGLHRSQVEEAIKRNRKKTLEFAGGIGGFSIEFAKAGREISFYDSNTLQSTWVKWYSKKHNLNIEVIDSIDELRGRKFDFIIAKDIAEHVINFGELYTFIMSLIEPEGIINLSEMDCCGADEFAPMHFKLKRQTKDGKDDIIFSKEENLKSLTRTLPSVL